MWPLVGIAVLAQPFETLDLARAVEIAERDSPVVRAAHADREGARGRRLQAGLYPNPVLFLQTTDGVLYKELDSAKYVGGVELAIPIGGRIGAAEAAADADQRAVEAQAEQVHRVLRAQVMRAFAEAYFAAKRIEVSDRARSLASRLQELTVEKLARGGSSDADQHKIEQELERLDVERIALASELEGAKLQLSLLMGHPRARIGTLQHAPVTSTSVPPLDALLAEVDRAHPLTSGLGHRVLQAQRATTLAEAQRIPDLTLAVAIATNPELREAGDVAVELSLSLPVPLIDRNQGAIAEARANADRAASELDLARNQLVVAIADAHRRLVLALEIERRALVEVLPDAEDALSRALHEYEEGDYNMVDVLESYRTWTEQRLARFDAQRAVGLAEGDLAELLGRAVRANGAIEMGAPAGRASGPFPRDGVAERLEETALGDLAADALRARYGAQIALVNGGALRAALPAGELRVRDAYAVFAFGNLVVTRSVTGAQLRSVLEHAVGAVPQASGRFLQVSGVRFTYTASAAPGARVRAVELEDGRPIAPDAGTYTVALIDFIAGGGDGYAMLGDGIGTMRDPAALALAEHLRALGTATPAIRGRIVRAAPPAAPPTRR